MGASFLTRKQYEKIQTFLREPIFVTASKHSFGVSISSIRQTAYLKPISDRHFCRAWNSRIPTRELITTDRILQKDSHLPPITPILSSKRLAHSNQTIINYLMLSNNYLNVENHFYDLISENNQKYENPDDYAKKIVYLKAIVCQLDNGQRISTEQRAVVEAGLWLHDCGYLLDSGDSHPDESYQILSNPSIQKALNLGEYPDYFRPSGYDEMAMMGGYHGILGDSFPLARIKKILSVYNKPLDFRALAIASALDSSAKILPTYQNGILKSHNMMFSRTLDMIPIVFGTDLTQPDSQIKPFGADFQETQKWELRKSRLRSLFSHSTYCYLSDEGYAKLRILLNNGNLINYSGFELLLDKAFFKCWIFMKDLVTLKPEHETGYFIDQNSSPESNFRYEYLLNFVSFITILSQIMEVLKEELGEDGDVEIDLCDNLKREYTTNLEFRQYVLNSMRDLLNSCSREYVLRQYKNGFIFCPQLKRAISPNQIIFKINREATKSGGPIRITFGFDMSENTSQKRNLVKEIMNNSFFQWNAPSENKIPSTRVEIEPSNILKSWVSSIIEKP